MRKTLRAHASEIINSLQNQQSNLDVLLKKHGKALSQSDRNFLQSLCYGVCREWFHLAEIENRLLNKRLKTRDQILSAIVRCGLYELGWMHQKDHAVVSEYVDASIIEGRPWARGLINAILRNFIRNRSEYKMERSTQETLWNHPEWLIKRIQQAWPKHWEKILVENNVHPPMALRINRKITTQEEYIGSLIDLGIDCQAGSAPDSVRLTEPHSVGELPGFDMGRVSVQDESSQWAAILVAPSSKERILDACAAPGGKTCHLLEIANCNVIALDISEKRLTKVTENLMRLGLRAITIAADASHLDSWWDNIPFDAILLDLPCSGTGVIRRHPDIRLMRSSESLRSLTVMQQLILDSCWETLKVGGRMIVTTCSILPDENDEQIGKFLFRHHNAELMPITEIPGLKTSFGIQQVPSHGGGDGFYYAALVKSQALEERVSA